MTKKTAHSAEKKTSSDEHSLLNLLEKRFLKNMHRHPDMEWAKVREILSEKPDKMEALQAMEQSGGEPDVVCFANVENAIVFVDCAKESPKGRRSICYDPEALASRKEYKPAHSAIGMALEMGVELLNEMEYKQLQALEAFDTKTSSWLKTPEKIRELGGAIFGDRRFDHVFIYHNGAESYYGVRGFRSKLHL